MKLRGRPCGAEVETPAATAKGSVLVPGQGLWLLHAARPKKKKLLPQQKKGDQSLNSEEASKSSLFTEQNEPQKRLAKAQKLWLQELSSEA